MRELMLLRHGKSSWKEACGDWKRPLKKRGIRDARKMGRYIKEQGLMPDLVYSSDAVRAAHTAELVCDELGIESGLIIRRNSFYHADREDLVEQLRASVADRVMLVGHNPGLEDLLFYLSDDPPDWPEDGKLMPTAALAWFTVRDDWNRLSQAGAKLNKIVRPKLL